MYEFADRLLNIALPSKDFRESIPILLMVEELCFLGVKEQLIFPEVDYDKVEKVQGMDIVFVTTAKTEESQELLRLMGMPFAKYTRRENVARKSLRISQQRKQKYSTREYNRCRICGRPRVSEKFGICRICFRELAYKGQIPGVRKASW